MIDLDAIAIELGCEEITPLARDVSPREYFLAVKSGVNYVLVFYHEANEASRKELQSFKNIDEWLLLQGLKAPTIHHINMQHCYALLEDLGRVSFGRALHEGVDGFYQDRLYMLGCDVLKTLKTANPPNNLPHYSESRIHGNRRQIIDYYFPLKLGKLGNEEIVAQYYDVWNEIERSIQLCPQGFVHGDFHLENLMVCAGEEGVKQCAIIDFQDALLGPLPYDLVNLLEDARIDVPQSLKQSMLMRYCEGMSDEERDIFQKWYRILGTQFHGRVLGLFIKLAAEQRRDKYLIHINRLQDYIQKGLEDPLLAPLKAWFDKQGVDFFPIKDLNGDGIRTVFQNIAC